MPSILAKSLKSIYSGNTALEAMVDKRVGPFHSSPVSTGLPPPAQVALPGGASEAPLMVRPLEARTWLTEYSVKQGDGKVKEFPKPARSEPKSEPPAQPPAAKPAVAPAP
jgi:hypothetical protein